MKYEQVTGRSLHDAMARARTILGKDIVLLETETLNSIDPAYDENCTTRITVGVDTKEVAGRRKTLDAYQRHLNEAGNSSGAQTMYGNSSFQPLLQANLQNESFRRQKVEPDGRFEQLLRKIDELHNLLSTVLQPGLQGPYAGVYKTLISKGVEQKDVLEFTEKIQRKFQDLRDVSEDDIRLAIEWELLPFTPRDRVKDTLGMEGQRILALVGSAGVGKTTTLLKIALHPASVPVDSLAILSLDSYGIGAGDALLSFSRLTGIPVETVAEEGDLTEVLHHWSGKRVILVDTPGPSLRFPKYIKNLRAMFKVIQPTDTYVVFDMRSDLEDMFLSGGLFSVLRPTGLIATKFDETTRPGKIISLSKGLGFPVVYASASQEVPGNYEPVKLNLFGE